VGIKEEGKKIEEREGREKRGEILHIHRSFPTVGTYV